MNQPNLCATCGGPLPADGALSGRCSRCLLEMGLGEESTVLAAESHLGKYQIQRLLGRGGMGEVHLAWDPELERPVALKLLPEEFAGSPERLRRFQREARAAAKLNHPNICVIYEVGQSDGHHFIAMEYVEGPTLRQHMAGKALPVAEAVEIALEIADALEAARAKNIVHRDIKSANILLNQRRQVKITDFGLAKHAIAGESGLQAATVTEATTPGMVVGTAAYMSPEQAMGREVDHRGDIFSFGVVFYEMLTGRLPFQGQTTQELLVAIATETPPLNEIPQPARRVLEKVLAKTAGERYQTAGEIHTELLRVRKQLYQANPLLRRLLVAACALAIAFGAWAYIESPPGNPLDGATVQQLTNFKGDELDGVISPDGKWVAFISNVNGKTFDIRMLEVATAEQKVWRTGGFNEGSRNLIRDMGFTGDGEVWARPYTKDSRSGPTEVRPRAQETPARPFPNADASELAWSVDGTKVAYILPKDYDSIYVAERAGTRPKKILGNADPFIHQHALVWSRDGAWIYFTRGMLGRPNKFDIWRISSGGGDPLQLTHQNTELGYPNPIDDRTVLYLAQDEQGLGMWLWALDVKTKITRRVDSGTDVYLALSGMANPDGRRLVATIANPSPGLWRVPILDGGRMAQESDVKDYLLPKDQLPWAPRFAPDEAGSGSLYFLSSSGTSRAGLWRYHNQALTPVWKGRDGALFEPAVVSQDGGQVAFKVRRNGKAVWHIAQADGANPRPIGERLEIEGSATFAPDGKSLLAGGKDGGGPGLFRIPLDGSAPSRPISGDALNPIWSGPANVIVYTSRTERAARVLHAARPDGTTVEMVDIEVTGPQPVRLLPDGTGIIYLKGKNFWHLDLSPGATPYQLTELTEPTAVEGFDITSDKQIVFDRLPRNSDIRLIELAAKPWYRKIF